jgi:hypothetical protein
LACLASLRIVDPPAVRGVCPRDPSRKGPQFRGIGARGNVSETLRRWNSAAVRRSSRPSLRSRFSNPVRFGLHESAFSRCHFMSPSRDRRMTETATRAGSRGGSLPQPRPSICSCAVQAWDGACVRLETVRPAGAVPPAIAWMIFGERNANGGRYHDRAAGRRRSRQDDPREQALPRPGGSLRVH